MEGRRELSRITGLDRPWQLLTNRLAQAEAICVGAGLSGVPVDINLALAVVDGRMVEGSPAPGRAVAAGWHDVLRFLASAADQVRPAPVDAGLIRALHWLLHRDVSASEAGRIRPGADLALAPPPPGADAVDRAVWTAAAVRRADPCWSGNFAVAHAVEVLLLASADRLAPWFAGRPSPAGDPREVLEATAEVHLDRCRAGEHRWFTVARLLADASLPDRMAGPCWDAAAGLPLANTSYRAAAAVVRRRPVSEQQASRDLRALVDAGLLQATGRTRDRAYRWSA